MKKITGKIGWSEKMRGDGIGQDRGGWDETEVK